MSKKNPKEATTKKTARKFAVFKVNEGTESETHWYQLSDLVGIINSLSPYAWANDHELKYIKLHIDTRFGPGEKEHWALPMTGAGVPVRIERLLALLEKK